MRKRDKHQLNMNIPNISTIFSRIFLETDTNHAAWQAIRITSIYLLIGCSWILLSDKLVSLVFQDSTTIMVISMLKGWVYVLVTAGLLYLLIRSSLKKVIEASNQISKYNIELEALVHKVQASSIAKSQFLANMSHEIRTPMNGIVGMTELALMTDPTEEQQEYLTIIRSSANALTIIVNDILDYSKLDANKLQLEYQHFDLYEMVSAITTLFRVVSTQKGLALEAHISSRTPKLLLGDEVRLRQVLSNLVGNAIKFTSHGYVKIDVDVIESKEQQVLLRFTVQDTGIGIAVADLPKLFDRFSQIDDSYNKQFGGTGLGLAISKRLVELMGGEIWVESQKDKGSSFSFTCWLTLEIAAPDSTQ